MFSLLKAIKINKHKGKMSTTEWIFSCGFLLEIQWCSKIWEIALQKTTLTQCDCVVALYPGIAWDLFPDWDINHSYEYLMNPKGTKSRDVNYKTSPISYLFLCEPAAHQHMLYLQIFCHSTLAVFWCSFSRVPPRASNNLETPKEDREQEQVHSNSRPDIIIFFYQRELQRFREVKLWKHNIITYYGNINTI